jgi:hypothetical protein
MICFGLTPDRLVPAAIIRVAASIPVPNPAKKLSVIFFHTIDMGLTVVGVGNDIEALYMGILF